MSIDDYRIPLLRGTSRDGCRNLLCRDACRDSHRTSHLKDVSRDNSSCIIVEMSL